MEFPSVRLRYLLRHLTMLKPSAFHGRFYRSGEESSFESLSDLEIPLVRVSEGSAEHLLSSELQE